MSADLPLAAEEHLRELPMHPIWFGAITIAIFIVLRLQSALELPIALFIVALAAVAEATLSAER